jgi:hypothetical protein
MATKIVTKNSSTASAVPTASDLVQGELAVNVADKRLFTEDNGGAIVELGTNPSGNVTFQDNGKAIFGAGSDLQIYHDGSNSYVDEQGTGILKLRGSAGIALEKYDSTEQMLTAYHDDAVTLFHNGSSKLATTSTGIDVTGGVTTNANSYLNGLRVGGADTGNTIYQPTGDLSISSASGSIFLKPSGTTALTANSSGNVGIGTSSPSEKLHVQGDGADILLTDSAGGQTAKLGATGSNNGLLELNNSAHVGTVFLNSSGDSYLNGGNVGIGQSSPLELLHIESATTSPAILVKVDGQAGSTTPTAELILGAGPISNNDSACKVISYRIGDYSSAAVRTSGLKFQTTNANAPVTAMVIDNSGNVGIGVTNVGAPLDIGSANPKIRLTDTGGGYSELRGNGGVITLTADAGNTVANSAVTFETDGSERMRIDSSGNVKINAAGSLLIRDDGTFIKESGGLQIGNTSGTGTTRPIKFYTESAERMCIDSSGNVGIGMSTPSNNHANANNLVVGNGTAGGIANYVGTGTGWYAFSRANANNSDAYDGGISYDGSRNLKFHTNAGTERMRISSAGHTTFGTTNLTPADSSVNGTSILSDGRINHNAQSQPAAIIGRTGTDGTSVDFRKSGTNVGSISVTSSATSYNTSSDQRLKENIADANDAGSKIDAIQVRQYDWKADGSHQDYGMIAQELLEVAPEAVSQGETEEKMMGVDYSKLVPMLIKEIQSLRNRVAQLEE